MELKKIIFLRIKLSAHGVQPDKDKITAILDMPRPTDKTGMLGIMVTVNFMCKFIANLPTTTSCIHEFQNKENDFKWTVHHELQWQKQSLTQQWIQVATDASKNGKGGVLIV